MSEILTGKFGTWTPTVTGVANVAASTAVSGRFMRVGSIVAASCIVTIDPTSANTLTIWRVTLPIASNFSSVNQLSGMAVNNNPLAQPDAGAVRADATNDTAQASFFATHTSNLTYVMTFIYRII